MMTMYPGLEKRFQDLHRADAMRRAERWRLGQLARAPQPAPMVESGRTARASERPRPVSWLLRAVSSLRSVLIAVRN